MGPLFSTSTIPLCTLTQQIRSQAMRPVHTVAPTGSCLPSCPGLTPGTPPSQSPHQQHCCSPGECQEPLLLLLLLQRSQEQWCGQTPLSCNDPPVGTVQHAAGQDMAKALATVPVPAAGMPAGSSCFVAACAAAGQGLLVV